MRCPEPAGSGALPQAHLRLRWRWPVKEGAVPEPRHGVQDRHSHRSRIRRHQHRRCNHRHRRSRVHHHAERTMIPIRRCRVHMRYLHARQQGQQQYADQRRRAQRPWLLARPPLANPPYLFACRQRHLPQLTAYTQSARNLSFICSKADSSRTDSARHPQTGAPSFAYSAKGGPAQT
jgi:hypothetical protein